MIEPASLCRNSLQARGLQLSIEDTFKGLVQLLFCKRLVNVLVKTRFQYALAVAWHQGGRAGYGGYLKSDLRGRPASPGCYRYTRLLYKR